MGIRRVEKRLIMIFNKLLVESVLGNRNKKSKYQNISIVKILYMHFIYEL